LAGRKVGTPDGVELWPDDQISIAQLKVANAFDHDGKGLQQNFKLSPAALASGALEISTATISSAPICRPYLTGTGDTKPPPKQS
jgi:hypothetical protein